MRHHAWLVLYFSVETGFCHVVQAGLKFLDSSDLPASVSQSAGITGVSHRAWPRIGKRSLETNMEEDPERRSGSRVLCLF